MKLSITIDCANDVFADDPHAEVARILRDLGAGLTEWRGEFKSGDSSPLYDANGNRAGEWRVEA